MIDFITTTRMTDRSVVASCLPAFRVNGGGLSGVVLNGVERPAKALEVATAAVQAPAYASAFAAAGAGDRSQKTKHNPMWAFRGLEPWRDPA